MKLIVVALFVYLFSSYSLFAAGTDPKPCTHLEPGFLTDDLTKIVSCGSRQWDNSQLVFSYSKTITGQNGSDIILGVHRDERHGQVVFWHKKSGSSGNREEVPEIGIDPPLP